MKKKKQPGPKKVSNVQYEWDLETLDITDPADPEVLDHEHADKLHEFFTGGKLTVYQDRALALVRTDYARGGGREWAYVTQTGGLPAHFRDANEAEGSKVPQRFQDEFQKLRASITFSESPTPPAP